MKEVAARVADIASLCYFALASVSIEIGIGWHYTPLRENPSLKLYPDTVDYRTVFHLEISHNRLAD